MMSRDRKLVLWLVVFVVLLGSVYALRSILLPFVLGMAVAYFLDPVADRLQRLGLSRTLAASALTIVFLVAVTAFFILLAPLLQSQVLGFIGRVPAYADLLRSAAEDALSLVRANLTEADIVRLREAASGTTATLVGWLGQVASGIWSGGLALVNLLSLIVITPIVTFYLLRDWDSIVAAIDGWLPRDHAETVREQVRLIDRTLAGFARGQAIVCAGLGVFYAIGLSLVGLEFGIVVGLVTGLISFVPYFGMLTGLALGLGLALAQFDSWPPVALVAGVFAIGQIAEGNFITPKLVGDRVGLHAVWMIFALLAGGALFGFLGVLLAIPAAATIGVLARFAIAQYQASALYGRDGAGPDES